MDGYASIDRDHLEACLRIAIANAGQAAREWRAVDKLNKDEEVNEIWAKRSWFWGPWNMKGAEARYRDSLGMFGSTTAGIRAYEREQLVKGWQKMLNATEEINGQPYLLALKSYRVLAHWQTPEVVAND